MRHHHKDDVLFWTALTGNKLDAQAIINSKEEWKGGKPCKNVKGKIEKNEKFKSQLGDLGIAMLRATKGGK